MAKSKAKSKPKAKAKPTAKSKPKPQAKANPKAAAKPQRRPKTKPKLKPKSEPHPLPKPAGKQPPKPLQNLFSPLDDRLIVEQVEAATRTPGGLYIPDTVEAADRPHQGKVLAVGRGHRGKKGRVRPLDVSLGDTVLFEKFMGTPIKIDGRECVLIRESQLLGIVRE